MSHSLLQISAPPPSLLHSLVEICLLNESLLLMHTVCEDEAR